ncbi:hypothetical protein [Bradyrhizobium sp. USDA 336]|uniref:hypothetical protein n=1 Tax=Bradyrhizobium sp. USDA 336 TaxID=3156311 RepID=UPI00384ABD96
MYRLFLAMPPAVPKQCGGLFAGQPTVARLSLGRQRHAYHAAVEAFLRVVIDRRAQRLQIAACAAWATTMLGISGTGLRVDLGEHLAAPVFVQALDPRFNFMLLARLADVRQID